MTLYLKHNVNFKALALATIAATTALAAPAEAKWTNKNGVDIYDATDFTGVTRKIVERLHANGIGVVDGTTITGGCDAEPGYKVYGFYNSDQNYVALCGDLTQAEIQETITHEAVHAYQDYRTGLNNLILGESDDAVVLFRQLDERRQKAVLGYEDDQLAIEAEAWYFEDKPHQVLAAWSF